MKQEDARLKKPAVEAVLYKEALEIALRKKYSPCRPSAERKPRFGL